ncbi:hypothetical protein [Nitrincola alkalisediminis]|uniref:hypothetical protein n=1 Tax=Nitrincola alkalisediminis TaxID=1366656 RepID=UPI0018734F2F|nr:hypothetical protein [Nitrincola alkalisediminis]
MATIGVKGSQELARLRCLALVAQGLMHAQPFGRDCREHGKRLTISVMCKSILFRSAIALSWRFFAQGRDLSTPQC